VPLETQPKSPPLVQLGKEAGNTENSSVVTIPRAAQETPEAVEADDRQAPMPLH
jgi:hypothetical protein